MLAAAYLERSCFLGSHTQLQALNLLQCVCHEQIKTRFAGNAMAPQLGYKVCAGQDMTSVTLVSTPQG